MDLISRQAAIDAIIADKIENGLPVITDTQERDFEVFNSSCDRHAKILKELPSAQKTGKWIYRDPHSCSITCSVCGGYALSSGKLDPIWLTTEWNQVKSAFCPNCGAKMTEE